MKKIILAIVMFISLSTYSQVYINGKKVAESGASDISIVNGDVYIDGKSIDELTEDVEEPQTDEVADPNLYETKNVDAYNKWYNSKGKKLMEKEKKETKEVFLWIIGSIGFILAFITLGFVVAEIRLRIKKRKSESNSFYTPERLKPKKEYLPKPNWADPLHHDMSLPEVESPIKNRNR